MKISLVSVLVNDPVAAHKFYTEVLGFVSKTYMPEMQLAIVASPEEPNSTSILLEPNANLGAKDWQATIYNAGMPVIVFGVADIGAEYERLKAKGVTFRGEPTKTEWGTQVLLEDTCGNLVQLHQV
jgi:predicted enzyme related to lactoylglutathione lyase